MTSTVDAGTTTKTYSYDVPEYFNGTIRVMAVAVAPDALGAGSTKPFVRGPFVLSPTTPLFVTPMDEFVATVAVANNVEGSGAGEVRLRLLVGQVQPFVRRIELHAMRAVHRLAGDGLEDLERTG